MKNWARHKPVALLALTGGGLLGAQPASATTQFDAIATAGVSASSNPFLLPDHPPGEVLFTFGIEPQLTIENGRSSLVLDGNVRADQYLQRYGTDVSEAIRATYQDRLSEKLSLHAGGGFSSTASPLQNGLLVRQDPSLINVPVSPFLPDPSLVGLRTRVNVADASAGLTFRPSARSTWTLDNDNQFTWGSSGRVADYNYYSLRLGYQRAISQRTSLTASIDGGIYNYSNRAGGDGYIVTPLIGVDTQFNARWSASLQVGASLASTNLADGGSKTTVSFSGTARICSREQRQNYCLSAGRAAQPTLDGQVRTISTVGFDYDRKLSERSDLNFTANYNRSDRDKSDPNDFTRQYASVEGTYSRHIGRRLQGYISAGVDKAFYDSNGISANYHGTIGLRYQIGRVQ